MNANRPTLYIFSGLPGSGKSTLSQQFAQEVNAFYLRIDTIEQALRDLCRVKVEGEGYGLAYRVAADNLRLSGSVVADSCNPIELTRREWEQVAIDADAVPVNIEIVCSDPEEHRNRVEQRRLRSGNPSLPTWEAVEARQYDEWTSPRILIDTAHQGVAESLAQLKQKIREHHV